MPDQDSPNTPAPNPLPRRIDRRRRRDDVKFHRRRQAKALLAGGLVLGVGATATFAAWTDQEQATGEFHAGQFAIEANVDGQWQGTNQMQFEASGMFPGEDTYASVLIRTTPDTTVDGELTVTGSGAQGALAPHLRYRAVANVVSAEEAENFTCDASNFTAGADYVYASSAGAEVVMNSAAEATGTHTVASGEGNVVAYCFHVVLAEDAPNETQGQSAEHTWTWNAESVVPE